MTTLGVVAFLLVGSVDPQAVIDSRATDTSSDWTASEADLPTLESVVAVMATREASTLPFGCKYSVEFRFGEEIFWPGTFSGDCAVHDKFGTRSLVLQRAARLGAPPTANQDEMVHLELLEITNEQTMTVLTRHGGDVLWKGKNQPVQHNRNRTPADFGLRLNEWSFSSYLSNPGACVVGSATVQGRECLRVVATYPGDLQRRLPIVLDLSKAHGYYPLRMLFCTSEIADLRPDARVMLPWGEYGVRITYEVNSLAPLGDGWFPTEARLFQHSLEGGVAVVSVEADSLTQAVTASSFALPLARIIVVRSALSYLLCAAVGYFVWRRVRVPSD